MATPASGFTGTTVALGKFGPIDVFNQALLADPSQETGKTSPWLSMQKTKGVWTCTCRATCGNLSRITRISSPPAAGTPTLAIA